MGSRMLGRRQQVLIFENFEQSAALDLVVLDNEAGVSECCPSARFATGTCSGLERAKQNPYIDQIDENLIYSPMRRLNQKSVTIGQLDSQLANQYIGEIDATDPINTPFLEKVG